MMDGSSGRGPTKDISPLRMLKSCGSSSILYRRSSAPKGKTRGSFLAVIVLAKAPHCVCMVRNLYMVKSFPLRPTRRALYTLGPGLARRMPTATRPSSGATTTSAIKETTISKRRLPIVKHPGKSKEQGQRGKEKEKQD